MSAAVTLAGLCIESVVGRGWRILDPARKVRTPWLHDSCFTEATKKAAMYAVARTDLDKLTDRHTRDGEWVVVHRY